MAKIGVIGGSGLYDLGGIGDLQEIDVETPYGQASDAFMHGRVAGVETTFLARHGRGHRLLPGELNHRANIFAMKKLGVEVIISIAAVGSFRDELKPGDIVLVDQFVDRSKRGLEHSFFGRGIAAHISFAHPTCDSLRAILAEVVEQVLREDNASQASVHNSGTYLNMEGPAFSTLAESQLYKSWGMDVIGMTNLAEAKLAREAEICYQTIAMVTDYDCWHESHGAVSVEMILQILRQNAELARKLIKRAIPEVHQRHCCQLCPNAVKMAVITNPKLIPPARRKELAPLIGKYIS